MDGPLYVNNIQIRLVLRLMDTHETQVNQMEMKIEALQENLGICRNATSIDRNRVSVLLGKVMRVKMVNFCYFHPKNLIKLATFLILTIHLYLIFEK